MYLLSLPLTILLADVLGLVPRVLAHNFVECTNIKSNLTSLLTMADGNYNSGFLDHCDGYPRGVASPDTDMYQNIGDQGYPWQFIWPMQDGTALKTHRACHWLQENPVYDPTRNMTTVKPGATIMLRIATNGHASGYNGRASGHYKIYIAGDAGTHITTSNQLTDDRVVFFSPENKYAHIIGDPKTKNFNDPGYAWLPFALVDPTGKALPAGTYNFVWTWWWPTGENEKNDFMIPSYSSCFDIKIDEDAEDEGFLTQIVKNDPQAHIALIGNTTSPGAYDTNSPWPPYPPGYLQSNYDGIDPSNETAKRTFQPYWTQHVDAVKMPEPTTKRIPSIKGWTELQRQQTIVSPPGSDDGAFPMNTTIVGNITTMADDSLPITEKITPITAGEGTGFNDTVFYPNSTITDPSLTFNATAMIFANPVSTYTAIPKAYAPEPLEPASNTTMPISFSTPTNGTDTGNTTVLTEAATGPDNFVNLPGDGNSTTPVHTEEEETEPSPSKMPDGHGCDGGGHDGKYRKHSRAWTEPQ